jgi:hypothetical protein
MSEQLTFHNTSEQREKGSQPTILIERSRSGEILTATATGQYDDTGREFYSFIEDGEQKEKPLGRISLSDQTQDRLAAELAADRLPATEHAEHETGLRAAIDMGEIALDAAGIEAPVATGEHDQDPHDYLRRLLPPVTRPQERAISYDTLISGTDEELERDIAERQLSRKELDQQKYYDRFVTDENRQSSRETLTESLRKNPALERALQEAGIDVTSTDAVDAIRENADVRYSVAKYFAEKLERMVIEDPYGFGERIQNNRANQLKEDPQTGVMMTSRDYVVSFALKMLGGEFSERHADDWLDRDESGRVILGQHRDAARIILMSPGLRSLPKREANDE